MLAIALKISMGEGGVNWFVEVLNPYLKQKALSTEIIFRPGLNMPWFRCRSSNIYHKFDRLVVLSLQPNAKSIEEGISYKHSICHAFQFILAIHILPNIYDTHRLCVPP